MNIDARVIIKIIILNNINNDRGFILKRLASVFFGLMAIQSLPASAQAIGIATLGSFQYTLVDLDLNDGITPSITFSGGYSTFQNYLSTNDGSAFIEETSSVFNNFGSNLTLPGRESVVSFTGSDINNLSIALNGNAFGSPDQNGNMLQGYNSNASHYSTFSLSGNTQVVFSVLANLEAYSTGPVYSSLDLAFQEYSEARAGFSAYIPGDQNNGGGDELWITSFNSSYILPGSDVPIQPRQSTVKNEYISATVSNLLFDSIEGRIDFSARVNGTSPFEQPAISEVPVPAAMPLMASALMLFGFGCNRMKK